MAWKIFNFNKKQELPTVQVIHSNSPVFIPYNYVAFTNEGYSTCPYVYSCINKISKSCAGIDLYVTTEGKEVENHPLQKLIEKPNPFISGVEFIESLWNYLLISGNTYIQKISVGNSVRELYLLRPDRVQIIPSTSGDKISHYSYSINGKVMNIAPEDILHITLFNPLDDYYGLSPIQVAALSIDNNNGAKKWNTSVLQNAGMPSGILEFAEKLEEDDYNRVTEAYRNDYGGFKNAGKIIVIDGTRDSGVKWTPLSLSAQEISWIEGLKLSTREIALIFNIPPELIGDTENKTYSNYKEARKYFYLENILPNMDWLISKLNSGIGKSFNAEIVYDKDDIEALYEGRELLWDIAIKAKDSGIITPNEARELIGYTPVSGGDDLYMSATLLPYASVKREVPKPTEEELEQVNE